MRRIKTDFFDFEENTLTIEPRMNQALSKEIMGETYLFNEESKMGGCPNWCVSMDGKKTLANLMDSIKEKKAVVKGELGNVFRGSRANFYAEVYLTPHNTIGILTQSGVSFSFLRSINSNAEMKKHIKSLVAELSIVKMLKNSKVIADEFKTNPIDVLYEHYWKWNDLVESSLFRLIWTNENVELAFGDELVSLKY